MLSARPRPAVAGAFLSGSILGASATSAALLVGHGLVSPLPSPVLGAVGLAVLVVLAGQTAGVWHVPLPQNARQIPRTNFLRPASTAAFWFGFELGTGVRTYLTTAAPYALAVTVLVASPEGMAAGAAWAAIAAVSFGIGRSFIVASQVALARPPIEPPRWALGAANLTALTVSAIVVAGQLG